MKRYGKSLAASVLLLSLLAAAPHKPASHELRTVELAGETIHALSAIPLRGIPHVLLRDAAGVAIIPHVVKAGLVIGGRFGHGVILMHEPGKRWSNPVFVTLSGKSIGGQVGIESTDLVLVFKTRKSLDRALRGKLTLGADVTVAAGPLGREAEAASDRLLRAEIYSYSRSRGLFAGVALEGARIQVDAHGNEAFYGLHGGRWEDVCAFRGAQHGSVASLKDQLYNLGTPPTPPPPPPPPARIVPARTPPPLPPPPLVPVPAAYWR
jgi:lipid-binding SYLF domain-containing protein